MSALGVALAVAVVLALVGLALVVHRSATRVAKALSPAEGTGYLHRLALASEKLWDQQPVQRQASHLAEQNEALVLGFDAVLNLEITHPDGMKDDVVLGREQGAELVKDALRAELAKAMK